MDYSGDSVKKAMVAILEEAVMAHESGQENTVIAILKRSSYNEEHLNVFIAALKGFLDNEEQLKNCSLSELVMGVSSLGLRHCDDIIDYHKKHFFVDRRFHTTVYGECLVREGRSERKRSKTNGEKISEWASQGIYVFTDDDFEFGTNEVKNEARTHISKVRKLTEFTPPKDLRGVVVVEEDTIDFKLSHAKDELAAFVLEKNELESKAGTDAETRRRLEELDGMILGTREMVARLEGPSSGHNLCIFGEDLEPSNVPGGKVMHSTLLDKFGVDFMTPLDKFGRVPESSSFVGAKFMSPTYLDKFEGVPEPPSFVGGKFMSPTYLDTFRGVPEPSTSVGGKFLSSSYLDRFGGVPNVVGDKVASVIDLSNFGVPEQATSVRGQNQSADELRNFGVQEDADCRED